MYWYVLTYSKDFYTNVIEMFIMSRDSWIHVCVCIGLPVVIKVKMFQMVTSYFLFSRNLC